MVRYLIFGLWLLGLPAWGQEGLPPIVLNGQPVTKGGLDIRPRCQFFPDSSSDLNRSLAWVRRQQFYPFKPGLRYRWDVSLNWSRQQVWFRFLITNMHPIDTVRLYAHTGVHADITLYELSRTASPKISRAGFLWRWDSNPLGPLAQAMRFKEKLHYQINLAPGIDAQYLRIPPLLLQPYVENAIWHGLMHKPDGGTVIVEVSQPQEDLLHIEITDDGVGRERAAALKSKSAGRHKSFGMQVTADRIRMINQLYAIQTQAQVYDLVDSFGGACGTKISLDIPV